MRSYLKTKDYSVSGEEFELVYDPRFDMLITKPQPEQMERYYKSEAYISHTDAKASMLDKLYQLVKKYSLGQKIRLANKHTTLIDSVLDVGAGTGDFLIAAKNRGWKVEGVEPNINARDLAKEKGLTLKKSLNEIGSGGFDLITLWHVLEHVPNLEQQIRSLEGVLNEQGTLLVAVPNYKSFDAKHYKEHWAAYDVPRHLWHFSKTAIERLFFQHGLKVVKIKPMVFDSFYVSLLSEKYKTGTHNYMKAVAIGLWSNIVSLLSKESSSQIYVLKKHK